MKEKSAQKNRTFGFFGIALVLVFSFVFLLAITPAFASPAFQTVTGTPTTAAGVATLAPTTAAGAAVASPTAGAVATLAAPAAGAGTPTALVPVTGADLTQSDGTRGALMVAVGLIGLFLIAYGVFARLAKRTNR